MWIAEGNEMRLVKAKAAGAPVLLATWAAWVILAQNPSPPATEFQITAKKYEFTPETIRVSVGNHVKLVITAEDHTHGFKLEAMRINEKVEKGKPVTVEFTPTEAGTFPFDCSHFCGLGHKKMKGQLIVE
jgi:cytochrome c oxidase subunit 2